MAITTWLNDYERLDYSYVTDTELNELFQEVRKATNNSILVQEYKISRKRWFRKKKIETLYAVYNCLTHPDYQVINFYVDGGWSINTTVTKSYLMAYFYGILTGINKRA